MRPNLSIYPLAVVAITTQYPFDDFASGNAAAARLERIGEAQDGFFVSGHPNPLLAACHEPTEISLGCGSPTVTASVRMTARFEPSVLQRAGRLLWANSVEKRAVEVSAKV